MKKIPKAAPKQAPETRGIKRLKLAPKGRASSMTWDKAMDIFAREEPSDEEALTSLYRDAGYWKIFLLARDPTVHGDATRLERFYERISELGPSLVDAIAQSGVPKEIESAWNEVNPSVDQMRDLNQVWPGSIYSLHRCRENLHQWTQIAAYSPDKNRRRWATNNLRRVCILSPPQSTRRKLAPMPMWRFDRVYSEVLFIRTCYEQLLREGVGSVRSKRRLLSSLPGLPMVPEEWRTWIFTGVPTETAASAARKRASAGRQTSTKPLDIALRILERAIFRRGGDKQYGLRLMRSAVRFWYPIWPVHCEAIKGAINSAVRQFLEKNSPGPRLA